MRLVDRKSLCVLAGLLAFLLLAPQLGLRQQIPIVTSVLFVAIFAYAWHPVGGILGELSIAHVVFWAAGSYSLVISVQSDWPLLVAAGVALAVGGAAAALLVFFIMLSKLEGFYVMVVTLIFAFISIAAVRASSFLGQNEGISLGTYPMSRELVYAFLVILLGSLILLNLALLNSRRGLVWLAIQNDAEGVSVLGWSVMRERLIAYALTGSLCALGGLLYGAYLGHASPGVSIDINLLLIALLAVYVGGAGTGWGPLVGVVVLEGLAAIARAYSTSVATAQYFRMFQYLVALAFVIIFFGRERKRSLTSIPAGSRYGSATAPPTGGPEGGEAEEQSTVVMNLKSRPPQLQSAPHTTEVESIGKVNVVNALSVPDANASLQWSGALKIQDLKKSFGGNSVLDDVTFEVNPGEVVGLVGPNGAGKSTICNIVSGTIRSDAGELHFGDVRVDRFPPHKRASLGLARTFQTPRIFQNLTLAENVVIAGRLVGSHEAHILLHDLGITAPERMAGSATLVERRMVEIARLMSVSPKWVLLDEPLAGLSPEEQRDVLDLVRYIAAQNSCVLIIEHLIPIVAPVTDRMVVLHGGELIADGPPELVLREQHVVDAYLGQPVELASTTE